MRDAARALDDVSDHLGEVLRRADQLLSEWSGFGAQVRAQVEREVAAISTVVDSAVARAAGSGLDHAITDRLRALTAELERLEQRTRAASRAVVEHRQADRRVLWVVVAGIVLANALLVVVLLRKPVAAPATEPIRIESTVPPAASSHGTASAAGSADTPGIAPSTDVGSGAGSLAAPSTSGTTAGAGSAAAGTESTVPGPGSAASIPVNAQAAGSNAAGQGSDGVGSVVGTRSSANPPAGTPAKAAPTPHASKRPGDGASKSTSAPMSLPPRAGNARPHKKQP